MLDYMFTSNVVKKGTNYLVPSFVIAPTNDLMIRGGKFYAIWDESTGLWSTQKMRAVQIMDKQISDKLDETMQTIPNAQALYLRNSDNGMIDRFDRFVEKQMPDNFVPLDEELTFLSQETNRADHASHRLSYDIVQGDCKCYDRLMSVLYTENERIKIEWSIGCILSGDSKETQKFVVLYGGPGTGKSTVLNIIELLFEGYWCAFDAKALGSKSDAFALEPFRANPLVAIQHDGDLSKIEDNTRLNSIVSHETMTVNEKFHSAYSAKFNSFLYMGTNKPVKITDSKSGILRRLIDVTPTGDKLGREEYDQLIEGIRFELGQIAYRCLNVYLNNKKLYNDYVPFNMMGVTNIFYNFMCDHYDLLCQNDGITLKSAWALYKEYTEEGKFQYTYNLQTFREELKNYFENFEERSRTEDGAQVRSWYSGFIKSKFVYDLEGDVEKVTPFEKADDGDICRDSAVEADNCGWLKFSSDEPSLFDRLMGDNFAQYAVSDSGGPERPWAECNTVLKDLDTSRVHYVLLPENHIVIDFDLKDEDGNKSLAKNIEAASKWPQTYAELSKSGSGIHLHYIYTGDTRKLAALFAEGIEIKVFTGFSSLRRRYSKCVNLAFAPISSGLPIKEKKMINKEAVRTERHLRAMIIKNLRKQIHAGTKPSVDFIYTLLDDAYRAGLHYDVTDLRPDIIAFAANSSHQAEYCLRLVSKMKFCSEEPSEALLAAQGKEDDSDIVFYDVEVFPNLLLVNWKVLRSPNVVRMINPSAAEIEELMEKKLVGFNCRRYDNHILYARHMGYSNAEIFDLSQRIIAKSPSCFFGEAYNLSYTDVYDFCSKKQSLKKWEIELGIHHKELGLPWDQPVPEELWVHVAEYCDNDVIATEATFLANEADWTARKILADISGLSRNDTTNNHTTRIIFGKERNPVLTYTHLEDGTQEGQPCPETMISLVNRREQKCPELMYPEYFKFNEVTGQAYFPGYVYERGHSRYRGDDPSEGGYVYAEPGMYKNIALLDVASLHPTSLEEMGAFGPIYTPRFSSIKKARIAIKHKDYEAAGAMFEGKLKPYLTDDKQAKKLSYALKIAINSVYGLTSAKFDNKCRDRRNLDNTVAKRGALFMINLRNEVQARGFTVAHIKTDSIKIPDATPEIISFVVEYGKQYGYTFEHEATYSRMCLVNDAVYIAQFASVEECEALYGSEYVHSEKDICKENKEEGGQWTATGTQFAVPYVFKTLFSHEAITLNDLCETNTVSTSMVLDMNEGLEPDEHNYVFVGKAGQFTPVLPGHGGGMLLRDNEKGGYSAVSGSKGYRWLESETVRNLHKEDCVDFARYDRLVEQAVTDISQYGDMNWFSPGWSQHMYEHVIHQPEQVERTEAA